MKIFQNSIVKPYLSNCFMVDVKTSKDINNCMNSLIQKQLV